MHGFGRAAVVAAFVLSASAANATPLGYIVGTFSNPILQGNVANSPGVGQYTHYDNSGTAVTSINNAVLGGGQAVSSLTWGTNPDGASQVPGNSSTLNFASFTSPVLSPSSATSVVIGTMSFYNGTSALDSLIFGATLNLYWTTDITNPTMTFLGSDQIFITTTQNQYTGTGLTNDQLLADADYVNICGNSSNICGTSIESFESTEEVGYFPAIFTLSATYDSDPGITLTGVDIVIGDGNVGNQSPAPQGVPEPFTLAIFGAGLAGAARMRKRKKTA